MRRGPLTEHYHNRLDLPVRLGDNSYEYGANSADDLGSTPGSNTRRDPGLPLIDGPGQPRQQRLDARRQWSAARLRYRIEHHDHSPRWVTPARYPSARIPTE